MCSLRLTEKVEHHWGTKNLRNADRLGAVDRCGSIAPFLGLGGCVCEKSWNYYGQRQRPANRAKSCGYAEKP